MSVICRSPHRTLFRTAVLCTTLVVFAGCGAEKESTHEDSHEKPAHWPGSLNEAADFMDARLQLLETSDSEVSVVRDELTDLVTWAPEIAADTDLSEEDWLPIYELSEAVRLHLLPGDVDPLLIESDFDRLCKLLRAMLELPWSHSGSSRVRLLCQTIWRQNQATMRQTSARRINFCPNQHLHQRR
jgi:hypothetical protein